MRENRLQKSIMFAISYFDVLDLPLTSFEVWRYLYKEKSDLADVITTLDELIRIGKIEMKNGFYFLPERSNLVDYRQEKYGISERYWNKALKAAKILSYLPFIKMVAVVNSLAIFNCKKDSDIDLFIITEKGKIWSARGISSLILQIFGLRRHGKRVKRRICVSFYVSESQMNLNYTADESNRFMLGYWIAQIAPVFNRDKTFEKFRKDNKWILDFIPNAGYNITDYYTNFKISLPARFTSRLLAIILRPVVFENIARKMQRFVIKRSQEKIGNPPNVIYNDQILKFQIQEWKRERERNWQEVYKKLNS